MISCCTRRFLPSGKAAASASPHRALATKETIG
jgi:hypothetical protein